MGESPVRGRWGLSPSRAVRDRFVVAFGWMLLPLAGLAVVALVALQSVLGSFQDSAAWIEHTTMPLLGLQASATEGVGVNVLLRTTPNAGAAYTKQVRSVEDEFAANSHYADPQIAGAVSAAHAHFVNATAVITGWLVLPVQQQAATLDEDDRVTVDEDDRVTVDEDDRVTVDEDERSACSGLRPVDGRHGGGLVVSVTRTAVPGWLGRHGEDEPAVGGRGRARNVAGISRFGPSVGARRS